MKNLALNVLALCIGLCLYPLVWLFAKRYWQMDHLDGVKITRAWHKRHGVWCGTCENRIESNQAKYEKILATSAAS